MIDPATSTALDRIASRDADVRAAYRPGAVPSWGDVATPARNAPSTDPLSVVFPQGTYAATKGAGDGLDFSRDGSFHFVDGELRGGDGRPTLGFALGDRTTLAPLRVDPYDAALGRALDPRIEADGSVGYTRTTVDPRSGERRVERVAIGRIALARFPAGTQPERVDATHVRPPHGIAPHFGVPADGSFGPLATHARDLGRIDVIAGLEKMKEAYDAFEALQAAHHGRGQTEKIAMDLVK